MDPILPRVLLVDDHPTSLDGTRRALDESGALQVVAMAKTGAEALAQIERCQPDAVVLDLHLPDISGVEVARRLRVSFPDTTIVVLTGYDDIGYQREMLRLGVRAFLNKTATGTEIASAVRTALDSRGQAPAATHNIGEQPDWLNEPLTARELEVLQLLAAGMQNNEIASELGVKERTVEFHVTNILEKLRARSRSDVRELAIRFGWVTHPARRRPRPQSDG